MGEICLYVQSIGISNQKTLTKYDGPYKLHKKRESKWIREENRVLWERNNSKNTTVIETIE